MNTLHTAEDRRREDLVGKYYAMTKGLVFHRFGPMSSIDAYFLHQSRKLAAVAEIKVRNIKTIDAYGSIFLQIDKYHRLYMASISMGVEGRFIVACHEGIFEVDILSLPVTDFPIEYAGRTDRDPRAAPNDQAPQIHVPYDWFHLVTHSNEIFK